MATQLTPHEAMVAWGEACSKYLALEPGETYKALRETDASEGSTTYDVIDAAVDVVEAAEVRVMDAYYAARAAYQADGQPAAVRILVEFAPFGYGDAAEIEAVIGAILTPPTESRPETHETPPT